MIPPFVYPRSVSSRAVPHAGRGVAGLPPGVGFGTIVEAKVADAPAGAAGTVHSGNELPSSPAVSTVSSRGTRPTPPSAEAGARGTRPPAEEPRESAVSAPGGFLRSADSRMPHLPRFQSIPESAKYPAGPFHQAPAEFGGDWWQVNPFVGSEPWRVLTTPAQVESLPEGFEELFGPRPESQDFKTNREYWIARTEWEQDLKYFNGVGVPEGADAARLELATQEFEEWGLGRPVFFQDRYGWRVRFPDSAIRDFGGSPNTAVQAPHILIAHYQIQLIREGGVPAQLHPWLPDRIIDDASQNAVS